ncbi:uncharacterized protein LOC132642750 [Lycium barbarum]|uniref:uncharacterized protein LOC132642750 n=1 Tax=Lycium barbarum TaxID=112863 RepID=UPI00293EDC68|nr:uncharacterized protein LOC132642750 [Lycium barbarum]
MESIFNILNPSLFISTIYSKFLFISMARSPVPVLALFLIAFIITLTVEVKASRDLPVEIAAMEQRVAIVGDIVTCLKRCNVQSDCSDGWLCSDCAPDALGSGYHCDKFTANGQGYFATTLQARYK